MARTTKYVKFKGRIVIVGFGSIGQGILPLILRHFELKASQITIVTAEDRPQLITACRALDRVLLWGWYVVPNWHLSIHRLAFWNKFGWPDRPTRTGYVFDAWWVDAAKDAALAAARASGG